MKCKGLNHTTRIFLKKIMKNLFKKIFWKENILFSTTYCSNSPSFSLILIWAFKGIKIIYTIINFSHEEKIISNDLKNAMSLIITPLIKELWRRTKLILNIKFFFILFHKIKRGGAIRSQKTIFNFWDQSPKLKIGYRHETKFRKHGFTNMVKQFCRYPYFFK